MIWNPEPHVRHAWSDTKTIWGKMSLILFYSLIWYFILTSAWFIFYPRHCLMSSMGGYDNSIALATVRSGFVFTLGFFAYADVGGYKVKNIAMVTVFVLGALMVWSKAAHELAKSGCQDMLGLYGYSAWAILALILAMIDEKLGERPRGAEALPLNT
jgi:hypothetical protein